MHLQAMRALRTATVKTQDSVDSWWTVRFWNFSIRLLIAFNIASACSYGHTRCRCIKQIAVALALYPCTKYGTCCADHGCCVSIAHDHVLQAEICCAPQNWSTMENFSNRTLTSRLYSAWQTRSSSSTASWVCGPTLVSFCSLSCIACTADDGACRSPGGLGNRAWMLVHVSA